MQEQKLSKDLKPMFTTSSQPIANTSVPVAQPRYQQHVNVAKCRIVFDA